MSAVSSSTMAADKPLTFADSIEDSIKCEREEQDKFSLLADMPRVIQAHTLSFLESPNDGVTAAKACKCFYKILVNQREMRIYNEQIIPFFPSWLLSIFSDWRNVLKLKQVKFETNFSRLIMNLENFTDPIIRGIDSEGNHFIAIKYTQKNFDGTTKNTIIEILLASQYMQHSCLWRGYTNIIFRKAAPETLERLKRLLNNENVGVIDQAFRSDLYLIESETKTIFDGTAAAALIKV
ncbi:MAG: hypothetical protein KR126chlam6_01154 [Candidatus Anoxychlamydiales bacterium]|nr:hypothetical protein [Candidatus Anoxychlamydiales bacterium]